MSRVIQPLMWPYGIDEKRIKHRPSK